MKMINNLIEEFTVTLKFQTTVNTETGEVTTECISRKIDKPNLKVTELKPKKKFNLVQSSTPQLILEDNKFSLNDAAIELMNVDVDAKIDIKYERQGKMTVPVIGTDENFGTKNGCRLTKSHTVSCRGSKHDELVKYGTTFEIRTHQTKPGLFILVGDVPEMNFEEIKDEDIELPEDLDDLIADDVVEIDESIFKL